MTKLIPSGRGGAAGLWLSLLRVSLFGVRIDRWVPREALILTPIDLLMSVWAGAGVPSGGPSRVWRGD